MLAARGLFFALPSPRGPGCLAPGHVHSGRVAGHGCAYSPRCPSSGLRPRVLAFSVPAPLGACIPERWCAECLRPLHAHRHPTPPLSEAAGHFLALLSGCFLGHNTGILLWTCPSPCCSGTFQAPTHLSSAHITWLPGCPHAAPQSCDAGVSSGHRLPPYHVCAAGPGVGGFDQRRFERAIRSSEKPYFKDLSYVCCGRAAVVLVKGIYRTQCAVWPAGWAAKRPGRTLWEAWGVSGLELGTSGQRNPRSSPRSPASLGAAQALQAQAGLAALCPGVVVASEGPSLLQGQPCAPSARTWGEDSFCGP